MILYILTCIGSYSGKIKGFMGISINVMNISWPEANVV